MNNKGQAFSTFKLLIAAVVAVAILGILLSILGGVMNPVGFEDQAKSLLRDVSEGGIIKAGPQISFSQDSIYKGSAFSSAAGGKDVVFQCGPSFCSPDDEWGDALTIDSDGRSNIVACCEGNECFLGVGIAASEMPC